jgi:ribonuclease HII
VLVDGDRVPPGLLCPARSVVGGDALEPAIMAASILAKVTRDRHMLELHQRFPHYGFDRNKGYATAVHLAALASHGPCAAHRLSFSPVREQQLALFGGA